MQQWCVVQTKSNQEDTAAYELKQQSFQVFLPTYTTRTTGQLSKTIMKIKPLFPNYLFVAVDKTQKWRSINSTRGVLTLVACTEDHLAFLPQGWVEDLMYRLSVAPPEDALENMIHLVKGDKVQITTGEFEGHIGTYLHNTSKKIMLLLTLLGRENKVCLSLSSVAPV
jgi:transcription elongation factor/antiterminator RfaH